MIGYFVYAGDTRVGQQFLPYEMAFNKLIKQYIKPKSYGESLVLILIQYNIVGEFLPLPKEKYHLKSYRIKERSIAVAVNVNMDFRKLTDLEKRNFVINTTMDAVHLVQEKMAKLGASDINFSQLLADIEKCASEYLHLSSVTNID